MAGCEKCWKDAFTRSMCDHGKSQAEHYQDILQERESNPCTLQEQAGEFCPRCDYHVADHPNYPECPFCR